MTQHTVLVAGLGNVFFGDDAFGVEVIRALGRRPLPRHVRVMDVGIRSVDLSFALQDGWELAILVDATQRGHRPGTLTLVDLDEDDGGRSLETPVLSAHALHPATVVAGARASGARLGRLRLLGCEPEVLAPCDASSALGLSEPVRAAVPAAVRLIEELIHREAVYA